MTFDDLVLLALIALGCFFALRSALRRRKSGKSCCGDCANCGTASGCRRGENTK